MINISNLTKNYQNLQVLKGINLTIQAGEMVAIVGASGAGKTTLLQIMGSLDKPDSGNVIINGVDITTLSSQKLAAFRNTQIGFIFQFHQLLPEFTALENVCFPAWIGNQPKAETEKRAMELLDYLGLKQRYHHKPGQLSGGEQQRVAVARALINKPAVVFADEPSGNLDSHNAEELHRLFLQLQQEFNQTFVIVTHNNQLADSANRKLVMRDGLIVQ